MELVIVSGIQVLALLLIGAVDYLTTIRAKTEARRPSYEVRRFAGVADRLPRLEPESLEELDHAA